MGDPLTPEEQARLNAMLAAGVPATGPAPAAPAPAPVAPPPDRGSLFGGLMSLSNPREAWAAAKQTGLTGMMGVTPQNAPAVLAAPGGPSAAIAPEQVEQGRRAAYEDKLVDWAGRKAAQDKQQRDAAAASSASHASAAPMPQESPLTYVPGGWQPASRSGRLEIDDGTKQEFMGADALHQQGIEQSRDASVARNDADAAEFQRISRGVRGMDNYVGRQEGDRQLQRQLAQMKLEDLTDQFTSAKDPKKAYADDHSPAKLFAIIGVALGGYSASMKGGTNQALEAYEKELDRQLDKQRLNLQKAHGKLTEQRGLLATMRENFGDDQKAEQAAKVAYLSRAEFDVKALAAQSNNPEVHARATELLGQLQDRRAARQIEFDKLEQGSLHEAYRQGQYVGGPQTAKLDPEKEKLFVPTGANGDGYYARLEREAEEARKLEYAKETIVPKLDKLEKKRDESNFLERLANSTGVYKSERMRDIASTQKGLAADVRRVEGIRGFGPEVEQLANDQAGDFSSILGSPEANARAFKENINTQAAAYERGQAGQGARNTMALGPDGRPQTVAVPSASMAAPRADMPASFKPVNGREPVRFQSPQHAAMPRFALPPKAGKGGKSAHRSKPKDEDDDD